MPRPPWCPDDDRIMVEGAGAFALQWFHARLRRPDGAPRTRASLYARARALWGVGGFRRGVFSLRGLAEATGYSTTAIRRAQEALNHRYKRLSPDGPYLISYDQREDVVAWLRHDYWSARHHLYRCLWCACTERRHVGSGLCGRCYHVHRRLCLGWGVPHRPSAQARWLDGLGPDVPVATAWQERLARGWVLERVVLEALCTDRTAG